MSEQDDDRDGNPIDDVKHGLEGEERPSPVKRPSDEPGGPPVHQPDFIGPE